MPKPRKLDLEWDKLEERISEHFGTELGQLAGILEEPEEDIIMGLLDLSIKQFKEQAKKGWFWTNGN